MEWYVARAPGCGSDTAQLVDFIYSEYCLRKELQETPDPEEYFKPLPPSGGAAPKSCLGPGRKPRPPSDSGSHAQPAVPDSQQQMPQPDREKQSPYSAENTTSGTPGSETSADATQAGRDKTVIVAAATARSRSPGSCSIGMS